MNTKSLALSLVASVVLTCLGLPQAMAQHTHTPAIDNAQREIHDRIQYGISSGRITPHEAHVLYQREREIRFREMRMKRDGAATPQERRQLRYDLENLHAEVEAKIANHRTVTRYSATPGIDRAQHEIRSRIEYGIRTGRITHREADILFARERRLHRHEAGFKADGHVNRMERQHLREEIAMLNGDIDRMMANRWHY